MREIKCRAKSQITGEWLLGTYIDGYIINGVIEANSEYISIENWEAVYPESRGQYTGLTDKNGVEIYEGDVVEYRESIRGQVLWVCDYRQQGNYLKTKDSLLNILHPADNFVLEVIGNIYENSELLEESK